MELANLFWLLLLIPALIEAQREAQEEPGGVSRRKLVIKDQHGKVNQTAVGILEAAGKLRQVLHHEAKTVQCTTFDVLTRTEGDFCLCLNKPSELCQYLRDMNVTSLIPAISQMNCGHSILENAFTLVKHLSPPVHCLGNGLCQYLNHGLDDRSLTEQQVEDSLKRLKPFQMLMPSPCLKGLISSFLREAVSNDSVNAIGDLLSSVVLPRGDLGEIMVNQIRVLNGGSLRPEDVLSIPEETLVKIKPEEWEITMDQVDRSTREIMARRFFKGAITEDSQKTRRYLEKSIKANRLQATAIETLRPLSAISADSAKQMLQVPGLEFSTSLGEIEEMTPAQVCFSDQSDSATHDVYQHLTSFRRTFAEKCGSTLGENLPASLQISKKPSDILTELQQSDSTTKIIKAKPFSENIDKLTEAMKAVLRESLTVSVDSLTDEVVTNAAVTVRELPLAEIMNSSYMTTGKEHYCRTMVATYMEDMDRAQVKDILEFCKSTLSLCDLNDLLSELSAADVNDTSLLDDTTFMECKGTLSRSRHPETLAAIKTRAEEIGSLSREDHVELARSFAFFEDIPQLGADDLDVYCPVLPNAFSEILLMKDTCSSSNCPPSLMGRMDRAFPDLLSACWEKFVASLSSNPGGSQQKRETICSDLRAAGETPYVVTIFSDTHIANIACDAFNVTHGCLDHIAVDELTEVQITALATRSQTCLGAADTWDTATQTALGILCLGLSEQNMAFIELNQEATVEAIGQNILSMVAAIPHSAYSQYKRQASKEDDTLTSLDLTSLGLINCGMTAANIRMVPTGAISKVAGLLGNLKCFNSSQCGAVVEKLLVTYGVTDVVQLTATQIADMGNLVVCLGTSFIQALTADKMGYITKYAIGNMPTADLQALTVEQIGFLSVEQANAVTQTQLGDLSQAQQAAVTCVKNPSDDIC